MNDLTGIFYTFLIALAVFLVYMVLRRIIVNAVKVEQARAFMYGYASGKGYDNNVRMSMGELENLCFLGTRDAITFMQKRQIDSFNDLFFKNK